MTVSVLTTIGSALADRSRATAILALMDGRARTAGELARHVGVAASTMSEHLGKLEQARLVEVVAQGRHRYFRIASDEIGALVETIGGLDLPAPPTLRPPPAPEPLRFARTCYNHLAGSVSTRICDRFLAVGHVSKADGGVFLSPTGTQFLTDLGVGSWQAGTNRPALRVCLDWTERRDHLAGPAAEALLTTLVDRRWLIPGVRPRSLRVTDAGRRALADWFGISASSHL